MADFDATLAGGGEVVPDAGGLEMDVTGTVQVVRSDPAIDVTPPTVTNFVPAVSSSILRTDTISFDVTDASGFARIVVQAQRGASGRTEVIHDSISFRNSYTGSVTAIVDGFSYTVGKLGYGWPETTLTLRIFAFDLDGNQSSPTDFAYTVTNPLNPQEVVLVYKMRGVANPGPGYETWIVYGTPDFAGTFAPGPIFAGTAVVTDTWTA